MTLEEREFQRLHRMDDERPPQRPPNGPPWAWIIVVFVLAVIAYYRIFLSR